VVVRVEQRQARARMSPASSVASSTGTT
jgi:hypothetical protein